MLNISPSNYYPCVQSTQTLRHAQFFQSFFSSSSAYQEIEVLHCDLVLLITCFMLPRLVPQNVNWIATLGQAFSVFPFNLHHYHCHGWLWSPLCPLALSPPKATPQEFVLMLLLVPMQMHHLSISRMDQLLASLPRNCNYSSSHRSDLFSQMLAHARSVILKSRLYSQKTSLGVYATKGATMNQTRRTYRSL